VRPPHASPHIERELRLTPAGAIVGVVRADGVPIEGAVVIAAQTAVAYGESAYAGSAHTDANGRYEIRAIAEGDYNVTVRSVGVLGDQVTAGVRLGEATALDFDLASGEPLRVRVTDATGQPLVGASVSVTRLDAREFSAAVTTGPDGEATARVTRGGQYRVTAYGTLEASTEIVAGDEGAIVTLVIDPIRTLRGRVAWSSGDPASNVRVFAYPADAYAASTAGASPATPPSVHYARWRYAGAAVRRSAVVAVPARWRRPASPAHR
jgi:hypothetical protein